MPGFVQGIAKVGGVSLEGLNGSDPLLDPKPIDQKMKGVISPMKTQISIDHWGCNRLIRLIALILALAVAAPVLLAQESDFFNGRKKHDQGSDPFNGRKKHDQGSDPFNGRKKHDPTGAWLIRNSHNH